MYIKRFLPVVALMTMVQLADAQRATQYITHTILKGETLSALSVRYKTTVGDIMRLNGMHTNSKLSIGQKVKIPVKGAKVQREETAAALVQQAAASAAPPAVAAGSNAPVHIVKKGETLYKIGREYHVTINQLKQWNHLTSDRVGIGQHLVVGAGEAAAVAATTQEALPSSALPAQPATSSASQGSNAPAVAVTSPATTTQAPVNNATAVTTTTQPAAQPAQAAVSTPVSAGTVVTKEENKIDPSRIGAGGYFASLYGVDVDGRSLTDISGTAMTFKTESGWVDKKYYILANNVSPGSIVKITNPDGNKVIYAKVLWNMKDMKENDGLSFRISNAAAEALGITTDRFELRVSYYD